MSSDEKHESINLESKFIGEVALDSSFKCEGCSFFM